MTIAILLLFLHFGCLCKSGMRTRIRLQSAMEYLMTYGWAILIIAVVLGALFQLGVFNSTNFAPRSAAGDPAGSVKVLQGSINLEGICSGEIP